MIVSAGFQAGVVTGVVGLLLQIKYWSCGFVVADIVLKVWVCSYRYSAGVVGLLLQI